MIHLEYDELRCWKWLGFQSEDDDSRIEDPWVLKIERLNHACVKDWMIEWCLWLNDWKIEWCLCMLCFILSRNAEFLLRESFLVCNVCWIDEHNNTHCLVHLSTSRQTLQTAMKTHLQFLFYCSFLLIYFRLMPSSAMTDLWSKPHYCLHFQKLLHSPLLFDYLVRVRIHGGSMTVYAFLLQSLNFAVMDVDS